MISLPSSSSFSLYLLGFFSDVVLHVFDTSSTGPKSEDSCSDGETPKVRKAGHAEDCNSLGGWRPSRLKGKDSPGDGHTELDSSEDRGLQPKRREF